LTSTVSNVDQRNSTARAKFLGPGTNNVGELSAIRRVLQLVHRWAENKQKQKQNQKQAAAMTTATTTAPPIPIPVATATAIPTPIQMPLLRKLHIFTDSDYSVGVLLGTMNASSNLDIIVPARALMKTLRKEYAIETVLQWVPAHVGIQCNEIADALANEAVTGHVHLTDPNADNITKQGKGFQFM